MTLLTVGDQTIRWDFYFGIVILAIILVYFGTRVFKTLALKFGIVDVPNQRTSHDNTTPRGGGMVIVVVFILLMVLAGFFHDFPLKTLGGLLINLLLIACLGFMDDLFTLRRLPRILGWVFITAVSILFGIQLTSLTLPIIGVVSFGIFSPIITFLWLIGVTNIFNFMDGINGLAASEALAGAGFLALIAFMNGNSLVFWASGLIFGAVLGFLPHNFPKARIFLGDGGSNFLGFFFAALAIIGSQNQSEIIPFLVVVILLGMFLLDAGTTLIKRLPKGKDWLEPHRDHIYQRLIILGYSHVQITGLYFIFTLILGGMAVIYVRTDDFFQLVLLLIQVFLFSILALITRRLEMKKSAH